MNKQCENCLGTGLVGNGDKPWLHEGALSTCPVCNGTGNVDAEHVFTSPQNSQASRTVAVPVDKSVEVPTAPAQPKGIFARALDAITAL
jgi:DnaJ-class molecular chaperone